LNLLLDAGSSVHIKNSYGSEALYYACRHQRGLAPVILLLQAGACLNSQNKNGHTALIGAAIRNHTKIGRYLLRQGANIDSRGVNGETALFEAIFHNSHEFLRLLLQSSADHTLINNDGSTILHSVALEGDCETVYILLEADLKRMDPSHRNNDHLTAMEMIHRRSIIPEGFEEIFTQLVSSLSNTNLN
jgi:ankyrin repeat protein